MCGVNKYMARLDCTMVAHRSNSQLPRVVNELQKMDGVSWAAVNLQELRVLRNVYFYLYLYDSLDLSVFTVLPSFYLVFDLSRRRTSLRFGGSV